MRAKAVTEALPDATVVLDSFAHGVAVFDTGTLTPRLKHANKELIRMTGYSIEELATRSDYLEVCHLILQGELPTAAEKAGFVRNITYHTMVNEQITQLTTLLGRFHSGGGAA